MKNPRLHLNLRLALLGLVFLFLGAYLVYGLYDLSVEHAVSYQAAVATTSKVTTSQSGSRGSISDCNGNILAYDENSYDVMFYRDPDKITPVDSARYTNALMEAISIIEAGGGTVENGFYIVMDNDGTYHYTLASPANLPLPPGRRTLWRPAASAIRSLRQRRPTLSCAKAGRSPMICPLSRPPRSCPSGRKRCLTAGMPMKGCW